jgi:hypothetical protein
VDTSIIAKVLRLVKALFPRDGSGNGWKIPKFHAATKFPDYISRYGSAMNFFGGTGESAHKLFVKAILITDELKDIVSRGQSIYTDWKTNQKGVKYIVISPRRNWSRYFGTRIKID